MSTPENRGGYSNGEEDSTRYECERGREEDRAGWDECRDELCRTSTGDASRGRDMAHRNRPKEQLGRGKIRGKGGRMEVPGMTG